MAKIIYKNDKMAEHGKAYLCANDWYICFIFGGKAYNRMIHRNETGFEYFNFKKDRYYLEPQNTPDQAVIYKVCTTFLGADNSSDFYFFDIETAKKYLGTLENGEIQAVLLKNATDLSLKNGFTFDDLKFFNPEIEIIEL